MTQQLCVQEEVLLKEATAVALHLKSTWGQQAGQPPRGPQGQAPASPPPSPWGPGFLQSSR